MKLAKRFDLPAGVDISGGLRMSQDLLVSSNILAIVLVLLQAQYQYLPFDPSAHSRAMNFGYSAISSFREAGDWVLGALLAFCVFNALVLLRAGYLFKADIYKGNLVELGLHSLLSLGAASFSYVLDCSPAIYGYLIVAFLPLLTWVAESINIEPQE